MVLEFATTPFVGISQVATATKNFGVTATVCDSTGAEISNPSPLSLGTNLFICIESNVVGTKIPSITSFTAQKIGGNPYDIAAPSLNVVIRGLDSANVKVVMNLPARFFADVNEISLSGSVIVTRDNRRRLKSSRALEIESKDAEFAMTNKVNEGYYDDSASGRAMMMSTTICGIAAFLFM